MLKRKFMFALLTVCGLSLNTIAFAQVESSDTSLPATPKLASKGNISVTTNQLNAYVENWNLAIDTIGTSRENPQVSRMVGGLSPDEQNLPQAQIKALLKMRLKNAAGIIKSSINAPGAKITQNDLSAISLILNPGVKVKKEANPFQHGLNPGVLESAASVVQETQELAKMGWTMNPYPLIHMAVNTAISFGVEQLQEQGINVKYKGAPTDLEQRSGTAPLNEADTGTPNFQK